MMDITKKQLEKEYLALEASVKGKKFSMLQWLSSLSDRQLFVFMVGQTVIYGRSFEASVNNARAHMNNRQNAIILYSDTTI